MSLQRKARRSFGVDDNLTCPRCGKLMGLTRRGPNSQLGASYERQIFTCRECGHDVERTVDVDGRPPA
jgi:transcription elongation factor Elf1